MTNAKTAFITSPRPATPAPQDEIRLNPARSAKAAIRSGEIVASETTCFMLNFNDLWLSAVPCSRNEMLFALFSESPPRITKTRGFFEAGQDPLAAASRVARIKLQAGGVIERGGPPTRGSDQKRAPTRIDASLLGVGVYRVERRLRVSSGW